MFVYFLNMIFTAFNNVHDMMVKIDLLHKHTNYRTFYDLFKIKENATKQQIKKAHKVAFRNKNMQIFKKEQRNLLKEKDYDNFIAMGYSVLLEDRDNYDYVLRNGKMLYLDKKENFRTTLLTKIGFTIFSVLLIDLSIFIKRYFAYTQLPNTKRKGMPKMFLWATIKKVTGIF